MNTIAVARPTLNTPKKRVARFAPIAGISIEDTGWGYIIARSAGRVTARELVVAGAWSMGIALLISAAGMLISPAGYQTYETFVMKLGLALLVGAIGLRLVWYSSRGTETELQVDRNFGEIRQVVRNKVGKPTLIGKYLFEDIGGVYIDRRKGKGAHCALMLRYKNTSQVIQAAVGPLDSLEALRDRLGHDLIEYKTGADVNQTRAAFAGRAPAKPNKAQAHI